MTREQFDALMNAIGAEARAQVEYLRYEKNINSQVLIINAFNLADEAKKKARELLVNE